MDVCPQLLQSFFMLHAEFLFFVDHKQAEVLELHTLGKQRVCANYNVDSSFGQSFSGQVCILGRYKT